MAYQPGPKELQMKALREARHDQRQHKTPSTTELREKIAKTKGGGVKKAKKGMKRGKAS